MALDGVAGLVAGVVGLGLVHGAEPGHGWPVAASYALDRSNKWLYGFAASLILGVGHLISSIAVVVVFFWAKEYFGLTEIGWMNYVAGGLLIALGVREYVVGHSHGHEHGRAGDHDDHDHQHGENHDHHHHEDHEHQHDDHGHSHDHSHGHHHDHFHGHHHDHSHDHHHEDLHHENHHSRDHLHSRDHHEHGDPGVLARVTTALPFVGGHDHPTATEANERGLWGIAAFAFVLGFAHEEEFEIIAICVGSHLCLELMLVYAVTVIFGIVALTLLLIAGYEHYEERVERYADYLPTFSAAVLVLMGLGFLLGVF